MSQQQIPLTAEVIFEMFRETDRKFQETAAQMKETDRKFQETDRIVREVAEQQKKTDLAMERVNLAIERTHKEVGALGSRIGEIIENMVAGNIEEKFNALGYHDIEKCSPNVKFRSRRLGIKGEIDLLLENGDVAILIEVKTALETSDVRKHIEKIEKYRRWVDSKSKGDSIRFVGAVAGVVVKGDAEEFAHENGMYVIVQSGEAVEIVTPPKGFVAKEW
jgi:predicted AAA+ superfamily ATPase